MRELNFSDKRVCVAAMAPALPFKKRISETAAEAFLHQVDEEDEASLKMVPQV